MPSPSSDPAALLVVALLGACAPAERPLDGDVPDTTRSHYRENDSRSSRMHPAGKVFAITRSSGRPFGIAVSRDSIVYCTLLDAASLARTTLRSDSLVMVAVAAVPTDVAFSPAGNWAYVTNQGARTVGIVDTRRNAQVGAVPVDGDPFRVAIGPEGLRVYVTTNAGNLVQIDTETRTVGWTHSLGGNLNGLAVNADGDRIYVGDVLGRLIELNPDGEILRVIPLPGRPQGLALSSDGKELYSAGEEGELTMVDLETGVEKARISLGAGGFGLAVTRDEAQIWITTPATGQIVVVDRASRMIVARIALGGKPRRIAFDQSGNTAVIADEAGAIHLVR